MQTLTIFESAQPREAGIAGEVTMDERGKLTATPRAGSAKAAAFEAAWQQIRARPALPLRSREGAKPGGASPAVLSTRDVRPGEPDYLWAVKGAMLGGHGLRGEVEDEAGASWDEK